VPHRGLIPAVLVGAVVVPTAAAQQLRANPVSWSPDVVRAGEPVSVVLTLRAEPAVGAEIRRDGRRHVAVVIRGNGQARRFAATPLGSGRYRATIVFPEDGAWRVRVRYPGGETGLGKGGACVGDCAEAEETRSSPATGNGRLRIGVVVAVGAVLAAAALAAVLSRRRLRPS
jgi:hypothetical protein